MHRSVSLRSISMRARCSAMNDECDGVQADAHVLEWRLPEFCKLSRIPASKVKSYSGIIRGLVREYQGPLRHTRLPFRSDVVRPLEVLIGDSPKAAEKVLPDILRELRAYSSEPWSLSSSERARACLLIASFGSRDVDFDRLEDDLPLLKKAAETAIRLADGVPEPRRRYEAAGFPTRGRRHENVQFMQVVKSLLQQAQEHGGKLTFSAADNGLIKGSLAAVLKLLQPILPHVIPERVEGRYLVKTLNEWRAEVNEYLGNFPPEI
jgi:hypothetical protein